MIDKKNSVKLTNRPSVQNWVNIMSGSCFLASTDICSSPVFSLLIS